MADYSSSVRRFLDENRPAQIQWDINTSTIWAMAVPGVDVAYRENRLERRGGPFDLFRKIEVERTLYAVSPAENGEEHRIEVPFTITWGHRFVDGDVEYYPSLAWTWGPVYEMGAKIVAAARIQPVRVPLPEAIVTLPVPEWVSAVSWDSWSPAATETIITFASDARARWAEFIAAGEAAIGGEQWNS